MANICDTKLKLRRDEAFTNEEMSLVREHLEDEEKHPETACAYDGVYEINNSSDEGDGCIEVQLGTRWNVPTDELREIAKVFKCHISALGIEEGNGFVQVVHIGEDGEVQSDRELDL